ncbi:hypothetical protein ACNKHK_07765 [Shigella flexneri]
MLEHVTGKGRTFILAFGETELTTRNVSNSNAYSHVRSRGEPMAD